MHAKFEVSSFNRSRDMEGSLNFHDFTTPFDLILHVLITVPVLSLSVKFDANIFISDRYMAILLLC